MKKIVSIFLILFSTLCVVVSCDKDPKNGATNQDPPFGAFSYVDPLRDWGASRDAIRNTLTTPFRETVQLLADGKYADVYDGYGSVLEYRYVFNNDKNQLIEAYAILDTDKFDAVNDYLRKVFVFALQNPTGELLFQDSTSVVGLFLEFDDTLTERTFVWYVDRRLVIKPQ